MKHSAASSSHELAIQNTTMPTRKGHTLTKDLTPAQKQALAQFGLTELPKSLSELDQKILKVQHVYPKDWGWIEVSAYQTLLEALGDEPWWRQSINLEEKNQRAKPVKALLTKELTLTTKDTCKCIYQDTSAARMTTSRENHKGG